MDPVLDGNYYAVLVEADEEEYVGLTMDANTWKWKKTTGITKAE